MRVLMTQRAVVAFMAIALLSLAAAAVAAPPLTGTVVSLNHDLNYITVRDDVTGRNFKIDTRNMNTRQPIDVWNLRAGDRVTINGAWENSETYRADRVMFANNQPTDRVAAGLTGTVEDVNRDLNYFTVRDQTTGQMVKIDVRRMDERRSINVWQLHHGDLVTSNGTWGKNGTFRANFVNFADNAPMASGYTLPNVMSGVVESVNRDLNYFMLRDDATGRPVKVDVRDMDTRRSVNVWRLRTGDRISVDGSWSKDGDRFQATMVRF